MLATGTALFIGADFTDESALNLRKGEQLPSLIKKAIKTKKPLATSKEILERALAKRFAVGAFNANNMEMVQAIVETQ